MIISVITVVFNCKEFIGHCLDSIRAQTYPNIEHIIVDGGSSDGTLQIIEEMRNDRTIFVSEIDLGYYDALNKGIKLSTGSIIGILNADDEYCGVNVLEDIVTCFKSNLCEAAYGNVNYVKRSAKNVVVRRWRDANYNIVDFHKGWMPAHTALFLSRHLFSSYGYYSLKFGSCADYDLIIRFLYTNRVKTVFKNEVLISMRMGGMSNGSLLKVLRGIKYDYRILKSNQFRFCMALVLIKRLRKIRQLVVHG
ncbi:MAG: glycosyltransferase [Pedobacter sp.]|nr:glycosyltransferase [Pedobacter sp.]